MEFNLSIDLRGLRCPLPVLRVKKSLADICAGEVLRVLTTDADALTDIPAFVKMAGHKMERAESAETVAAGGSYLYIRKQ